jgi:methionyl-tRNA formyltransferase
MRVVFFGNHDVGIATLDTLLKNADVVGVVAHPIDHEEGVRYASLFDFASSNHLNTIRGRGKDASVLEFLRVLAPDLIWVTDYKYILPGCLLSLAKSGAVNLHPSLLPRYRGRASINWAILRGETEVGLTAHFIDEGVDTGDIIKQITIKINRDHDVGDALTALMTEYSKIARDVLCFFESGVVPRLAQDHSNGSFFPARKPEDGRIDWSQSAESILNLVRAVAHPYPGAFCESQYGRIFIWKACIIDRSDVASEQPGMVVELSERNTPRIQCGDDFLEILDYTLEDVSTTVHLTPGDRLL